jgi:hypothetical protein
MIPHHTRVHARARTWKGGAGPTREACAGAVASSRQQGRRSQFTLSQPPLHPAKGPAIRSLWALVCALVCALVWALGQG